VFLRKAKNKKTGRVYLSIVESYREPGHPNPKSRTVESLGYLDVLEKEYGDPIAFFEAEVARRNAEQAKEESTVAINIDRNELIKKNTDSRKNFGYVALSHIYHDLQIDDFVKNRQRHANHKYDANAIMRVLVFNRLLDPGSKRKDYENKDRFFESANFSLQDMYFALSFLEKHTEAMQLWLHERVAKQYNRNTRQVFYDVTNYYFEIDEQDELRRKGISKDNKPFPLVQMGLLCDNNGLPIAYNLFPGNTSDKITLRPTISKTKQRYRLGRVIVVADRGVITSDNIWHLLDNNNGYVFSMSIKGSDSRFKAWVLDSKGYQVKEKIDNEIVFKVKSRLEPREISVTGAKGKKSKKVVHEKQVVYYSKKYADRAKAEREAVIEKARDLIASPGKYTKATSYGAAKYVKNIKFDEATGEILEDAKNHLYLNEKMMEVEARFDGYYAIVTSEHRESAERIIEIYRDLWRIEEAFKVTKSELKTRPIYLSTHERIKGHFLVCFVALLIIRILEHRLKHKHSTHAILDTLRKANCSHVEQNYYLFDHYDDVLEDIGKELKIDFSKKYLTLKEIKSYVAEAKKPNYTTPF
jgi:transposase